MIVQKVYVQNTVVVLPSVFTTSIEFAPMLRTYNGTKFCVISPSEFTPALTIEKKNGKLIVTATSHANTKQVYDKKITSERVKHLPIGYVYYFNMDGNVIGVSKEHTQHLSFENTKIMVEKAKLTMAQHILIDNRIDFVHSILSQILNTDKNVPFENAIRVGFYIGSNKLRHTNKMALAGILAPIFHLDAGVRIKGITKHAPNYAEAVFWFELKQIAPDIFDVLKDEELKAGFMENLDKCL